LSKPTSQPIELSLFGQKIRVKRRVPPDSDDVAESPELVDQVVKLVQKKVKEAESRSALGAAPHYIAIVALLDLAAEYLKAKARTEDFKKDVELKTAELLAVLETRALGKGKVLPKAPPKVSQ